jgi:hypothetical protein
MCLKQRSLAAVMISAYMAFSSKFLGGVWWVSRLETNGKVTQVTGYCWTLDDDRDRDHVKSGQLRYSGGDSWPRKKTR